jgi:hypothetical protein
VHIITCLQITATSKRDQGKDNKEGSSKLIMMGDGGRGGGVGGG